MKKAVNSMRDASPSVVTETHATQRSDTFALYLIYLVAALVLLTVVIAPAAVSADNRQSGPYAGIAIGQSSFFTDTGVCDELIKRVGDEVLDDGDSSSQQTFDSIVAGTRCREDDTDKYFGVWIGYQFNPWFAIEGGYNDFGESNANFNTSVSNSLGTVNATGTGQAEARGVSLATRLSVPIGERFSLFGRLGLLAWDADASLTARGSGSSSAGQSDGGSARLERSDSGADVLYGVGAKLNVSDNVGIRADWTHYEVIQVDQLSLGLEVTFGQ